MDRLAGIVLWFRPASGRGMVRADGGRQYFFGAEAAGGLELAPGVMIDFTLSDEGGPVEAVDLAYKDGQRTVAGKQKEPVRRGGGKQPTKKQRQAAKRKVQVPPPPARRVAMKEGTPVNHTQWGSGHVVATTEHRVSVEFLSGVRKTFKPTSLTDLSGPDVPKAPEKRRRGKKKATAPKSTHRTIRRSRDSKD
jgi:hypothetical protein